MNEGVLAIFVIIATIGAGVVVVMYRDLIFSTGAPPPRQRRPTQLRRPPASRPSTPALALSTEIVAKPAAIVSVPVSSIATPNDDPEMIAIRAIAKLVRAKAITETVALETTFDVHAGNGKAYKAVQAKLKVALAELDSQN